MSAGKPKTGKKMRGRKASAAKRQTYRGPTAPKKKSGRKKK